MVKITDGVSVIEVTEGAYKSIYSTLGYKPCDVKQEKEEDVKIDTEQEEEVPVKDEEFAELLEKPIGQWTKEEVAKFVDANGIDTSSAKKLSEVKELVKEYIKSKE